MSTPITPITLTGSFHGELDSTNYDLVYPTTELPTLTSQFIPPLRESTSSDMNTLDSHYSSLEHMSLVDHWVGLEDDTPTVGSKEKNLAQIESDMAVHGSQ